MDAHDAGSKKEFEIQMEMEYKTLFASVGAKAAAKESETHRNQRKTTSTSVLAQGGSQEIASILSDVYSPTFKTEFKEWLRTIPAYPKAFRFQMGSITDLLNFRANDLFSEEKVNWGCEGNLANLLTEEKDGKTVKYYEVVGLDGTKTKYYCDFDSRQALEDALQLRRTSLQRAMEIYMEEGPISISNIQLDACERETEGETEGETEEENDFSSAYIHPSWRQITNGNSVFRVSFDMMDDLPSSIRKAMDIQRNASLLVRFFKKKWRTSDRLGKFHLYGGFDNGESKDVSRRKISILGLVLTFNEDDGTLILSPEDFEASKKFFPTLGEEMTGIEFAQVQSPHKRAVKRQETTDVTPLEPCKVDWSNSLRLDPTDRNGKCLHFTASTEGTIFVVFAALPKDDATWYTVEISPSRVVTYKGKTLKTKTTNVNARALGDASLYQSYFVCITETETSTLIEYGKSLGTSDSGDVYLNFIDHEDHLNVRFYAFGNDEMPAKVMDAHLVSRALTKAECKGDTVRDQEFDVCVQNCHKDCDPYAGCREANNPALPTGCYACRVARDPRLNQCIPECPAHKTLTSEKTCVPTFDVLLRPSADFGPIAIDDIPTLNELTLCTWIKIEGNWGDRTKNGILLVRYFSKHVRRQDFFYTSLEGSSNQDKEGIAFLFTLQTSSYRLQVDELKDGNWHQICVTWSGFNGVTIFYKTGVRDFPRTGEKGELSGGGNLKIGGMISGGSGKREATIHVTGVNLWKRVLSDQEIAKNAERCNAGEGDAKPWPLWYEVAQANSGFLRDTSQCVAPTPSAAEQQ